MSRLATLSLSVKLPLVLSVIVGGVAITIGIAMMGQDRQRLREALTDKALVLSRSIAVIAAEPLLRGDSWALHKALRQITQRPDGAREPTLVTAAVLDPAGRVQAHVDPARFPIGLPFGDRDPGLSARVSQIMASRAAASYDGTGFVEAMVPVQSSGKTLGMVLLRLSTAELDRTVAEVGQMVTILTFGLAMAGSLIGFAWSARTLRPLKVLAGSMAALGRGRVDPLPVSRGDEIGQLIVRFNRMTEELEDKRRLASELAANEKVIALGRIAAGVAHEVNNPLAGMLNCLSTLRARSNDPALVDRYLPLIEGGLKKIEALVKDLLIELRVEDANEIGDACCLEEVRDLIAAEIGRSQIDLVWSNELRPADCINPQKMQQVLLNLMRNALQAMPGGGRLSCRFRSEPDELVFEVEDTGRGIEPGDLGRIFDPFFTRRPAGTGLGLWIVLRLVQSMHGRVEVASVVGEGTQFRIRIPREVERAPQTI